MKTKLLSAAVIAAFLSAPTMADDSLLDRQSEMVQMLLKYDTNGDGIVSRDEIIAGKTEEFNAFKGEDEFLSWDEFKALLDSKTAERLAAIYDVMNSDAETSPEVTAEEFAAAFADRSATQSATVFALAAGDDNSLSMEEWTALHSADLGKQMWMFAKLDTDGDQQLTVDEYVATPQPPVKPKPVQPQPDKKGHR